MFARIAWPKYLEMKAESLEKLDRNFASETTRKTENSWQCIAASHQAVYSGFKLPIGNMQIQCTFARLHLQQT